MYTVEEIEKVIKRVKSYHFRAEDALEWYKKKQKNYSGIERFLKKFNEAIKEYILNQHKRAGLRGESKLPRTPETIAEVGHKLTENAKPYKTQAKKIKKPKKKWMSYEEQLKDPRWLEFRQRVFEAKGHKCSKCGGTEYLQVHHPKYVEGKYAWEYPIRDMVVLCGDCHKKVHGIE